MKLTYSTMTGDYFEKHVFEGSAGEILVAYDALFGNGEEPDRCPKCGGVVEGECLCEPESEKDCHTCEHEASSFLEGHCLACAEQSATNPYSQWREKPQPRQADPDRPPCPLTGRSCDTCKHQGACYGCGAYYAHWEPETCQNEAQGKS